MLEWRVGKWKDLPNEMKPAFEKITGGLPSVRYINGKFVKVIYANTNPLHYPEEILIPLDNKDSLTIDDDWGVRACILGGLFL
jgi:hypothetical protein